MAPPQEDLYDRVVFNFHGISDKDIIPFDNHFVKFWPCSPDLFYPCFSPFFIEIAEIDLSAARSNIVSHVFTSFFLY